MAPPMGAVLSRFDFPLYTLQFIDDKHFLVAGGGGGAKTGIPNAVEVFRFELGNVRRVLRFQPEVNLSEPIMNAAVFADERRTVLAAGMGRDCHLFSLRYKLEEEEEEDEDEEKKNGTKTEKLNETNAKVSGKERRDAAGSGVRQRKGAGDTEEKNGVDKNGYIGLRGSTNSSNVSFDVVPIASVRTDYFDSKKEGDSYQKVVRFAPDRGRFFTAGTDGKLRCWNFPDVETEPLYCKEVHPGCDVVDLDVSPDGVLVVTVGASDTKGSVVAAKDGAKRGELEWIKENYRFRGCRFGIVTPPPGVKPSPGRHRLFTIHCPKTISSKGDNFLTLWDSSKYVPVNTQSTGKDMLSTLTVSDDGIFVGVGTRGGSVGIFIAFSLQKLHWVSGTHAIFVTGLAFTPSSAIARRHVGDHDASLVSISADNSAQIHHVPKRGSISVVWVFLASFLCIYLVFWLVAELGL